MIKKIITEGISIYELVNCTPNKTMSTLLLYHAMTSASRDYFTHTHTHIHIKVCMSFFMKVSTNINI